MIEFIKKIEEKEMKCKALLLFGNMFDKFNNTGA